MALATRSDFRRIRSGNFDTRRIIGLNPNLINKFSGREYQEDALPQGTSNACAKTISHLSNTFSWLKSRVASMSNYEKPLNGDLCTKSCLPTRNSHLRHAYLNIARRLFSFHPMTICFPLVVSGAILIKLDSRRTRFNGATELTRLQSSRSQSYLKQLGDFFSSRPFLVHNHE
jgi:hypothetical protein